MLLATGQGVYADVFERVLYNGFLAGVSLDGLRFFSVDPLQVRPGSTVGPEGRQEWFTCACCPPNVMRMLASLTHYLATGDDDGLQVHQYATGSIRARAAAEHGPMGLDVATGYPFEGAVRLTVPAECAGRWTLSLRIPAWARGTARVEVDSAEIGTDEEDGYVRLRRDWHGGETVLLALPLQPHLLAADPRVDAVRGCVALERGPLVYCVEQHDQRDPIDRVLLAGTAREAGTIEIEGLAVPGVELPAHPMPGLEPEPGT